MESDYQRPLEADEAMLGMLTLDESKRELVRNLPIVAERIFYSDPKKHADLGGLYVEENICRVPYRTVAIKIARKLGITNLDGEFKRKN